MKVEWTSETPEINDVGMALSVKNLHSTNPQGRVWMHAVAAFPTAEWSPERWVQSIFLTVISESGLTLHHAALLKNRIIFPDEVKTQPLKSGVTASLIAFDFDLGEELGTAFIEDRYYIQLSAGQFHTTVAVVEIK
jgi:hypothetical protein